MELSTGVTGHSRDMFKYIIRMALIKDLIQFIDAFGLFPQFKDDMPDSHYCYQFKALVDCCVKKVKTRGDDDELKEYLQAAKKAAGIPKGDKIRNFYSINRMLGWSTDEWKPQVIDILYLFWTAHIVSKLLKPNTKSDATTIFKKGLLITPGRAIRNESSTKSARDTFYFTAPSKTSNKKRKRTGDTGDTGDLPLYDFRDLSPHSQSDFTSICSVGKLMFRQLKSNVGTMEEESNNQVKKNNFNINFYCPNIHNENVGCDMAPPKHNTSKENSMKNIFLQVYNELGLVPKLCNNNIEEMADRISKIKAKMEPVVAGISKRKGQSKSKYISDLWFIQQS